MLSARLVALVASAGLLLACGQVSPAATRHPLTCASTPNDIQASFNTEVVAIGQTVAITGCGFGNATGKITFANAARQPVEGKISAWSDTEARVSVPVGAVTGPVEASTARGEPFYPGPLVIEGPPNGVARIKAQPIRPSIAGEPITVTLTAFNRSGSGMPDVEILLTDGLGSLSCTTGSSGDCTISVTTFGSGTYIALSGTAWTEVPISKLQPPDQRMTLTTSAAALLLGMSATITATVTDPNGSPVAREVIAFDASGPSPVTFSAAQATTDGSGRASVSATSSTSGWATIEATTNHYSTTAVVEVDWSTSVVTSISPDHGPSAGGTKVTISGSGFIPSAAAWFGNQPASGTTFINHSTLEAVAPAGVGAVDVRVVVNGAWSPMLDGDSYTYGPPAVTAVTPSSGPSGGGIRVTISGSDFAIGTRVLFGTVASSSILVRSSTSIIAISPADAPGTVDIVVITDAGASATGPSDRFTFQSSHALRFPIT